MILVTGATGFIGNHVARHLADRNQHVRVLVRPSSDRIPLGGLDAETCVGDVEDLDSIRPAVRVCRAVFHLAAQYELWTRDPRTLYRVNVDGTRNVLQAALEASVDRVDYTSSVGTIAPTSDGTPVTEESRSGLSEMIGHYKRSKFLAERVAEEFAGQGLPGCPLQAQVRISRDHGMTEQ